MAFGLFIAIGFSLTLGLGLHPVAANLRFSVIPVDITEGVTRSLTANCSFSNIPTTSNISNLISITISKKDAADNTSSAFEEIASVNVFSSGNAILSGVATNAVIKHRVVPSGQSFLSLEWTDPSVQLTGEYVCEVHGLDSSGHVMDESAWRIVYGSTGDADSVDLIKALQDTQLRLDHLENQMAEMMQSVALWASILSYTSTSFNGSTYLLSDTCHANDLQAALICGLKGGYLVEIDTEEEYNFLVDFLNRTVDDEFEGVMTGGNDWQQQYHWIWRGSRRPVTFTRWSAGSPYAYSINRCILLERAVHWQMENRPCLLQRRYTFLCEVPDKRP